MKHLHKKSNPTSNVISPLEFEGLSSFEEIDSYELFRDDSVSNVKNRILTVKHPKKKNSLKVKKHRKEKEESDDNTKKTLSQKGAWADLKSNQSVKRKHDLEEEASHKKKSTGIDVCAWEAIFTPEEVITALKTLGFKSPSAIQKLSIPAAIKGCKDIIGAAETGSGKTLAFVIPIIHGILREKRIRKEKLTDENSDIEESDVSESEEEILEEGGPGCVKVVNNVKFNFPVFGDDGKAMKSGKKLYALIITPTRELAIQIQKHTDAVLAHTDIKSAVVIGGLSQEKQERLLKRGPEIVIGTPGRLWEMIKQGNSHLTQLSEIRFLAIDETDRMLEKSHFEELQELLELINANPKFQQKRQNFIFSATLMLTHDPPRRANPQKKLVKLTKDDKIKKLMRLVGVRDNPKIVDITRKFGTAETLSESKIYCETSQKETYLYYFIRRFPGRTLIFCNSITNVQRISSLLNVLQWPSQALHASKQQKQRLKSLERFASNDVFALLATDVAARGLDIPGVDHIIHYDVPRTAETYVHRSGRTARAEKEGLSVLLVSSSELKKYKQLCSTLNRASDLTTFPVDELDLGRIKGIVKLAKDIESMEFRAKKSKGKDWLLKLAKEAGLESEESSNDDDDDRAISAREKKEKNMILAEKKRQLQLLLSKPAIFGPSSHSALGRSTTVSNGQKLNKECSETAINLVKQDRKINFVKRTKLR